jgi:hypothetical protein
MNTARRVLASFPESGLIHRSVSFTRAAFDRFKQYQRHLEGTEGRRVTNSEALSRLILSHPET